MKDKSQRNHVFTTEQVTEYSRHVPGKNASHKVRHGCASLLCFGRALFDPLSLLWMRTLFLAIPFKNVIALIDVKMRHETVKKFGRNRSFSGAFVRKYSRTKREGRGGDDVAVGNRV